MYLINDVDTLRKHCGFAHTESGFDKVKEFVRISQENHLKPVLCTELYNQLVAHINQTSGSGSASASASSSSSSAAVSSAWLDKLVEKARNAVAFLTLYEGFAFLEVQWSSDGVHRIEGDELKSIHTGQRTRLTESLLKHGFNELEKVVAFLSENADEFDVWKNSSCYTSFKGRVIRSAAEYTNIYSKINHKYLTYKALDSFMREVEEDVLTELLGEELWVNWFNGRKEDDLDEQYKNLLPYLQRIVGYQAAAEAMPGLAINIEAYGIYTETLSQNEENARELSVAKLKLLQIEKERLQTKADSYKNKLANYLFKHRDDYTELTSTEETQAQNTGTIENQGDNGLVMM